MANDPNQNQNLPPIPDGFQLEQSAPAAPPAASAAPALPPIPTGFQLEQPAASSDPSWTQVMQSRLNDPNLHPSSGNETIDSFNKFSRHIAGHVVNFLGGALDEIKSGVVTPIRGAFEEPRDVNEVVVHAAGGESGLVAFRLAKTIGDAAENLAKAAPQDYSQAKHDYQAAVDAFHKHNLRSALTSLASTAADSSGVITALHGAPADTSKMREIIEATRPGGDLATPLGNVTGDLLMAAAPEALEGAVGRVAGKFAAGSADADRAAIAATKAATETAGDALAARNDFMKAVPPSPTAPYTEADYEIARNHLEPHHEGVEPIRGVRDTREALDHEIGKMNDKISEAVDIVPDEKTFANTNISVRDAVKAKLGTSVKKGFLDRAMRVLDGYENIDDPTNIQTDKIRRQLGDENAAFLKKNKYQAADARSTNPAFAAREAAADVLRNGLYDNLISHGIDGVREMRQEQGALIKVRDAALRQEYRGDKVLKGTAPEAGTIRKIATEAAIPAGAGLGGLAGSVLGPVGTYSGAAAGTVGGAAIRNALKIPDLTIDQAIARSFENKVATGSPFEPSVSLRAPEPVPPATGTQGDLPMGPKSLFDQPAPAAGGQGTLFNTPQTPAADAGTLNQIMMATARRKPFQAILDDPAASAAQKVEAARALDNLGTYGQEVEPLKSQGTSAERKEVGKTPISKMTKKTGSREDLSISHEISHNPDEANVIRLTDQEGKTQGMVKYVMDDDKQQATLTAAYVDKPHVGKGWGTDMFERAAHEAKADGARSLISDPAGLSMDAANVFERLRKAHPDEIVKYSVRPGIIGYKWTFANPESTARLAGLQTLAGH